MTFICQECGGRYDIADDDCFARFDRLLALDHSREEPWGSRHGLAFAAFALQHPLNPRFSPSLDAAWLALCSVYVIGKAPSFVFRALRSRDLQLSEHTGIPMRPGAPLAKPSVSICDLQGFEAATYAHRLDDWCRATLEAWGVTPRRI